MRISVLIAALATTACFPPLVSAQDARGSITGVVRDQQEAVIPGAAVIVTNTETNSVSRTTTNQTGYYEVNLLNPGLYSVAAEAPGFRRTVRTEVQLNVAGRLQVDFELGVGQVAESIEVTDRAPLLDTTTASGGRVIDNKQVNELPFTNMNPFALTALAPGMQSTGAPQALRPFDNGGTSDFNTMGGVGQNEYTIDGAPATGTGRRVGFIPPSDSVSEFKVETTPFDASYGHTSGAVVNVMTKAGTNAYHGALFDQHWQQRWNATPHFTRLAWENSVRSGKLSPDSQKQESGRQNSFGGSVGGPVRIPGLYNGKDKFFFFFSHNGAYTSKSETLTDIVNNNVPKAAWRQGDYSDLLGIDAVKYTLYDPRSARREGSRVIRTPFPGNRGIPVLNPTYKFYEPLFPLPNDVPGLATADGLNNYFSSAVPNISRFNSVVNRLDYNITERHRVFGRWYWNKRTADTRDWLYETKRGLGTVDLNRLNKGLGINYIWTVSASTIVDFGVNATRFSEGNLTPGMNEFKPTDVGFPAYLDQKADAFPTLPTLDFQSVRDLGRVYGQIQRRGSIGEAKVGLTTILGSHTLKYGFSERRYWYTSGEAGYSSGRYVFNNQWVRQADNTTTASNQGLEWAAFMMALPSTITIDTNDSGYWSTRFRSLYIQDDWRLTNRFRLSAGLRYEREGGITERYNRGVGGGFLYDAKLPFSDAASSAYAASPLPELPSSQFLPVGGVEYLGTREKTYTDGTHKLLPRIGTVYQINNKTVLRAGYGWYYDSLNSNNTTANQYGYSQPTNTTITSDLGLTFCCGVGEASNLTASRNPMADPFPVRADGTRFDAPYGNTLGASAFAGRSITLDAREFSPGFQQRWRIGVQREITPDTVLEVSYNGAWSRIPVTQRVNFLPEQHWATGAVRNTAVDNNLNSNVANPFYIGNFTGLASSNPALYQYLSTQSFFTSRTVRKNVLLRPFPQMSNLSGLRPGVDFADSRGAVKYHDLQVQFERRFARGLQTAILYTRAYAYEQDAYDNEFDAAPAWRPADQVRPNRLVWSAIWEAPFGKGKRWVSSGPMQHIVGGWQLSWIYVYQNGTPLGFGNRFFYGDIEKLGEMFNHDDVYSQDIHLWFDPSIRYTASGAVPQGFQGFDGRSAAQPGSYHVKVFPTRVDALRSDGIRNWDVKILRRFRITESVQTTFSCDLLNATNHTNFGAPNTDPTSTSFGRVNVQNGQSRFIQLNLRLEF